MEYTQSIVSGMYREYTKAIKQRIKNPSHNSFKNDAHQKFKKNTRNKFSCLVYENFFRVNFD